MWCSRTRAPATRTAIRPTTRPRTPATAGRRGTTGWPTSSLPTSDESAARGPSGGPARAYVGLGSNLGDREVTLRAALDRLGAEEGIEVVAVSSFRETDPVGVLDQPRFVNAAAELATCLAPRELLE